MDAVQLAMSQDRKTPQTADEWKAAIENAKWEKGDLVVLRPGLDEKEGLKAGEAAAVSWGPDSDGDYNYAVTKKIRIIIVMII